MLQDNKITNYETSISSLPNKIENNATWLKAQFDGRTDNEVKESINGIIDNLNAVTGASEIGVVVPTGVTGDSNVQSVINGLKKYTDDKVIEAGAGDMLKAIYDTNNNGKVDNAELATSAENGIKPYTQNAGTLTGSGENGKFKATDSNVYENFTINNVTYSVQQGEETEIELIQGCIYPFFLDSGDSTINFTSGGANGIPSGEFATPTDDIKIWLKCANTKSSKTLDEIVQDTALLTILFSCDNAMDYLKRSLVIQASVLASETAIGVLDDTPNTFITQSSGNATHFTGGELSAVGYTPTTLIYSFSTFESPPTYCTGGINDGDYVQYEFTPSVNDKWFYKFQIKTNNVGKSCKFVGVTKDDELVDLTEIQTSTVAAQLMTFTANPHLGNLKAIRVVKQGGTNFSFTNAKAWGK